MNRSFPRPVEQALSAAELCRRVGEAFASAGDLDRPVQTVASPAEGRADSLVFCKGATREMLQQRVADCAAGVIVVPFEVEHLPSQTLVVVEDPIAWFIRALGLLFPLEDQGGAAGVASDAVLGEGVRIGAGTVVERGCVIGSHSRIGPNCYLGPGTVLGERAFVQNNASLGSVGLGYHITRSGERLFFPHLGAAVLGDDVVVGAGSVVVRGQLDDTVIGERSRLGNLVNIGHNVKLGPDCAISSGSGVAGGAFIGARCNIGIGAMINAKIRIGADCQIGMGSVVVKSLPDGVNVFGNPARPLPTMERF